MEGEQQPVKLVEKQQGKRVVVILLVVTVGLSLLFYLKNIDWQGINWKLDLASLWGEIGGSETVIFEK